MRLSDLAWPAALLAAFGPALVAMARVWARVDYASHGFLVPLVALAAGHAARAELPPPGRHAAGAAVIAGGLALYLAGLGAGRVELQGLAFVVAVAGWVLQRWGGAGLRTLAFPVGFLVFMVPWPQELVAPLVVRLQLGVSHGAVTMLHAFGVSVLAQGNVLELPGGESLFVAEACSGITSIVTLLPLAVLVAAVVEPRWSRRALLVAAVVPIAAAGNLLRVIATVLAASRFGVERVTSHALHEVAGLLTFALACGAVLALAAWLRPAPRAGGA